MKTLTGSILVLSGAIMLGAGQLAQAMALSGQWQDTPVSMRVIGSMLCLCGLALFIGGFYGDDPARRQVQAVSGSILVLSGAVLFSFGKIALTIATLAGHPGKPIGLLAIASCFTLLGLLIIGRNTFGNNL